MERQCPARHCLVLQRQRAPDTVHRYARRAVPDHDGQQLLLMRVHGTRDTQFLAATRWGHHHPPHRQWDKFPNCRESEWRTAPLAPSHLHGLLRLILQLRRLHAVQPVEGGDPDALRLALAGDEPLRGGAPGPAPRARAHRFPGHHADAVAGRREPRQDGPDQVPRGRRPDPVAAGVRPAGDRGPRERRGAGPDEHHH